MMARQTVKTDDLDGTEATRTVQFAVDGVKYEVDLSEANAQAFMDLLAPYMVRQAAKSGAPTAAEREANQQIRDWARSQGKSVGDRGRIPEDVVAAFHAAPASKPATSTRSKSKGKAS